MKTGAGTSPGTDAAVRGRSKTVIAEQLGSGCLEKRIRNRCSILSEFMFHRSPQLQRRRILRHMMRRGTLDLRLNREDYPAAARD
ncbi:MAG TPA: hypothetical protein DCG12_14710 [Planctomycetaceae bacterium]|nr:hypothetical protein [Planctomycetaceae bacterium]